MNAEQRKELERTVSELKSIRSTLEDMAADENEKFDNLSEGLQSGEAGEKMQQAASDLEEAVGLVMDAIDKVEEVIQA